MLDDSNEVVASIGGLAYGGSLVGLIEEGPSESIGKKIFIREVAPGERVQALITADHKRFVEGRALNILNKSEARVDPPCPVFGMCGGCDLQHLTIKAQRQAKLEMVSSTLRLKAQVTPSQGIELIGEDLPEYYYRTKVSLHISPDGRIGFYRAGSGEVVDISNCLLASPQINKALLLLRPHLNAVAPDVSDVIIDEKKDGVSLIFSLDPRARMPRHIGELFEPVLKVFPLVRVVRGSSIVLDTIPPGLEEAGLFSQVNSQANQLLVECVKTQVKGSTITELYAGCGNFTFALAEQAKRIEAVELDPTLARKGASLAAERGLTGKLSFHSMSAEKYVSKFELLECLVMDPPRSGVKNLIAPIVASAVKQIVYISCNLPTLGRDLKELCSSGFNLEKILLVDMFPQTHHVETVSVLSR